ncbi:SRPBCC family protein [Mycobacterium manitobense]|uniref:SRPBCC family protein n=1 Tax=[Mycobacterium] manitobense TaxID=190147 RepID=A0A9X3BPB9_9MYCO|nr:SRPBCC family protein [[Mycobacterium] manitobense]
MRYRDQPTVEVTQIVSCDPETAWHYVTDIELPVGRSAELQRVEWLDGADHVEVGARFRGCSQHDALGDWQTICEVAEVEPGRRWTWNVHGAEGVTATWGFEVEPSSRGAIVRQWARMGPGPSGLSFAILATPDKEARIVARRLQEWQQNMSANLAWLAEQVGTGDDDQRKAANSL